MSPNDCCVHAVAAERERNLVSIRFLSIALIVVSTVLLVQSLYLIWF